MMYDYGKRLEPTADIGGRKLLSMGGSLMGYIQTGNAYHKNYYKDDLYLPSNQNHRQSRCKKSAVSTFLTGLSAGLGIVGLYQLFKKGKFAKTPELFTNLKSKIKFPNLNKIKSKLPNIGDIKSKLPNVKNITQAVKNFFKKS